MLRRIRLRIHKNRLPLLLRRKGQNTKRPPIKSRKRTRQNQLSPQVSHRQLNTLPAINPDHGKNPVVQKVLVPALMALILVLTALVHALKALAQLNLTASKEPVSIRSRLQARSMAQTKSTTQIKNTVQTKSTAQTESPALKASQELTEKPAMKVNPELTESLPLGKDRIRIKNRNR